VVLDLMIHDLDLLGRVVGRNVVDVRATGVRLLGAHEDVASARVTFEGGCVAQITASRVAETRCRTLRVFSRHGYLVLDCDRQEARKVEPVAGPAAGDWALRVAHLMRQGLDAPALAPVPGSGGGGPEDGVASWPVAIGRREPLKAEIEDWLACVRTGRRPEVDGEAAWRALALAERILASIERRGLGPVAAS